MYIFSFDVVVLFFFLIKNKIFSLSVLQSFASFDKKNQVGQQYPLFLQLHSCQKWKHDFEQHQKELIENKGPKDISWMCLLSLLFCVEKAIYRLYNNLFRALAIVGPFQST